jgi:hypothetical protein
MRVLARLQVVMLALLLPGMSTAQLDDSTNSESQSHNIPAWNFLQQLAFDQQQFWTGPTKMTADSAKSVFPFAAFTGILMRSDSWINA